MMIITIATNVITSNVVIIIVTMSVIRISSTTLLEITIIFTTARATTAKTIRTTTTITIIILTTNILPCTQPIFIMFRLIFKVFRAPPLNPFIVIPFFNSSILKMSIKSVRRLNSFNPKRLIKK